MKTFNSLSIDFGMVWLIVTDQASYMLKCFASLKTLFPNLHHISCLAHALHRVCDLIRTSNSLVDDFLGQMKVVFSRSNLRKEIWKEITGKCMINTQTLALLLSLGNVFG